MEGQLQILSGHLGALLWLPRYAKFNWFFIYLKGKF